MTAQSLKTSIRKQYTAESLRQIFAMRENDTLFFEVGEKVLGGGIWKELKTEEFHLVAWVGKEFLTDHPYFDPNLES